MQKNKMNEYITLLHEYTGDNEDKASKIATIENLFGIDKATEIIKQAQGRDIIIIYGKGSDEIEEIRFTE